MCSWLRVHALVAEHAARRDHAQRRAQALHAAHLHRRRVCAQQVAAIQPEGVLHIARRMIGRNVQGVEVVVFGFDFGTIQHGEAERNEKVLEFPLYARDRMQVAAARTGRRQGEIDPLGVESRTQGGRVELLLPGIERRFELLLGGVEHLADAFALFGRELSHALADFGERAFAAHGVHADRFELLGGCGGSDAREGTRRQFLNGFVKHVVEVLIVATGGDAAPT